ncbi:DNA recombination protein RmuC [Arenicella xantha]|uniref:DNA recombination protein RmuC n=1 Tax=Arenicella xantha TaxID=644221 RepID=A0A395JFH2_9GAMM|nr:DNA recombination protein RmuC [Arenicella xantha]RBP47080.1 DNA recombination protein RmuC [Arenicella xantha]
MNQTDDLLTQILAWLAQPIALYWLVASSAILLFALLVNIIRTSKRITKLDQERQQLAIIQATQSQKIDSLSSDNSQLLNKAEESSLQLTRLTSETAQLKSSRDEKAEQLANNENERLGLREMVENYQRKVSRLEADMREQNARLQSEQDKLSELKAQFEIQKSQLKTEFKVVSEEIIKERQSMLTEQNKVGVSALLRPLQDQIEGFQKRINQVHDEAVKGNTSLKTEIENVMKMGIKMRDEANSLTTALKGSSQQRGAWGEAQLERTLEMSGLVEHDHFEKQTSFVDDSGRRKQTDYLIKLPGDKCIVIDSKVSLNAYERASSADPEQQADAMKGHLSSVRQHINDLASKDYTNLYGVHSPDFILMFMPVEPAYIEALKQDPELFGYGYSKNVVLVSHTTLIPILRTVANLWMLDRSNKEARLLGERAGDIYNSVVLVSERLQKLGKTLNTASNHFNDTVTSLAGTQGLQGKVQRFNELSAKANKTMPELEHSHIEFDTSKLNAQPIGRVEGDTDE